MKIKTKWKKKKKKEKNINELPVVTQELICCILDKSVEEIVSEIQKVDVWRYGKFELYYWIDVLDTFDYILSTVTTGHDGTAQHECGLFMCPKLADPVVKSQVLAVLNFTCLLTKHSYSHHIYNSHEHLYILLASADLDIVLAVLNVLYVFGKYCSGFIQDLPTQLGNNLRLCLEFLAESWGGDKKGFGLAKCCRDISIDGFPPTASSVYFEYQPHNDETSLSTGSTSSPSVKSIEVHNVDKLAETVPELMSRLTQGHSLSLVQTMHLMTRLLFAKNFAQRHHRMKCVLIRLQAISVLVSEESEDTDRLINDGLVKELVEVLEMKEPKIQSNDLRGSSSEMDEKTIQIQVNPKRRRGIKRKISNGFANGTETKFIKKCQLNVANGAEQPVPRSDVHVPLVPGSDIPNMDNTNIGQCTSKQQLKGVMFDENTVLEETITTLKQEIRIAVIRILKMIIFRLDCDRISSTIVEVIGASSYHGFLPTLVRDCVIAITSGEVFDGITTGPLKFITAVFSFLYYLAAFVYCANALVKSGVMESLLLVIESRAIQPENISLVVRAVKIVNSITEGDKAALHRFGGWDKIVARLEMEVNECRHDVPGVLSSSVTALDLNPVTMETNATPPFVIHNFSVKMREDVIHCMPDRVILIKFVLRVLDSPNLALKENIKNFTNSSLPSSLAHIISNAEYYGTSIYLHAINIVTMVHDPSQLSSLQDNDLPWIIVNSLIRKKIPATPKVFSVLPKVLSLICLNPRGLQTFIDCEPFDHLFEVLIIPEYQSIVREQDNKTLGEILGGTMNTLMKDHPLLKPSVMASLIKLLKRSCLLENDVSTNIKENQDEEGIVDEREETLSNAGEEELSSDEDDDDDDLDSSFLSLRSEDTGGTHGDTMTATSLGRKNRNAIPSLTKCIQNVVDFVNCILSYHSFNNPIKDFISAGGLQPLISLIALPGLPLSFSSSPTCTSIIAACKDIECACTSYKDIVMDEGFSQLSNVLSELELLFHLPEKNIEGLKSMSELLVSRQEPDESPLLRTIAAADGYINLFIELSKFPPSKLREICVMKWASSQGQKVLEQLSILHRVLIWEEFIAITVVVNESQEQTTPTIMFSQAFNEAKVHLEEGIIANPQKNPTFNGLTSNPLIVSRVKLSLLKLLRQLVRICSQPLEDWDTGRLEDSNVLLFKDTVTVGLKIANLLNDCLTWELPHVSTSCTSDSKQSSKDWLVYARIMYMLYGVQSCVYLLFDEDSKPYHLMLHCFNERQVLDGLISSLKFVLTCRDKFQAKVNSSGEDHTCIVSNFLEMWLFLSERLINTCMLNSTTNTLPIPSGSQNKFTENLLFDCLIFITINQKAILPGVIELWSLVDMSTPVAANLMKIIVQFYKSETVIISKLNVHYKIYISRCGSPTDALSADEVPTRDDRLWLQEALCDSYNKRRTGQSGISSDDSSVTDDDEMNDLSFCIETELDCFSDELLQGMLSSASYVCDVVDSSCDLLVALLKRRGTAWRKKALKNVKKKALKTMVQLCDGISNGSYEIKNGVVDPCTYHLWLLTALMKELPLVSGPVLCQADMLQSCIKLLVLSQQKLPTIKREDDSLTNPIWLVPLLLMLEIWISIKNLSMLSKPVPEGHVAVWLWFDNDDNDWCSYYPEVTCCDIEKAYQNNEGSFKVSSQRDNYVIKFSSMMQLNLESGEEQPVIRLEVPMTGSGDDNTISVIKKEVPLWYCPLSEEQAVLIVTHCTRLLSVPLDPDALHTNMRLLLSLTRDPHLAGVFMSERGPHALLALTHKSCFDGFFSLSSLLFRHVLEDSNLLGYCMDAVIRKVIVGNLNNDSKKIEVQYSSEFDFVLRRLAPCVCRDQELFMKIAGERMRLVEEPVPLTDYSVNGCKKGVRPVRLKYEPPKTREQFELTSVQSELLKLLVDHFCSPGFTEDVLPVEEATIANRIGEIVLGLGKQFQKSAQVKRGHQEIIGNSSDDGSSRKAESNSVKDVHVEQEKVQPILTQSCILRLLIEIIVSYPVCAKAILESSSEIKVRKNDDIEVMSVVALILDYLLPASYIQGSSTTQVTRFARVFLQTLISTTLPDDALMVFVNQIKASFSRALALPESPIKHMRVHVIVSLLSEIVEPQTQAASHSTVNPTQFVLMLIRRGFIADLSKAIHSLDLSSSFLSTTINTILKLLENLMKIVTQFLVTNACTSGRDSHLCTNDLELGIEVINNDDLHVGCWYMYEEGDDYISNLIKLARDNFKPSDLTKNIDEMHSNPYLGQRSNIVQQFLSNITVHNPDPLSCIDGSEGTIESTTIPTNISRWREESIALDGATAFLCVAHLRSPLLAILSDELLSIDQVIRQQRLDEAMRTMPRPHPSRLPPETSRERVAHFILFNTAGFVDSSITTELMEDRMQRRVEQQTRFESHLLQTRFTGTPIVDHEGLACLLVLLFLEKSTADFDRLFKIFRSLSQHVPSCTWLITSLLSILKKTNTHTTCSIPDKTPSCQSHWLNMTVSNLVHALHVRVFNFPSLIGKHPASLSDVTIHPYALVSIRNNTLELIMLLARQFPVSFLPHKLVPNVKQPSDPFVRVPNNFWQILFHLDSSSHEGKSVVKSSPHSGPPSHNEQAPSDVFSQSPIGELMKFLDNPTVQGNMNLIGKILEILDIISGTTPKQGLATEDSMEDRAKNDPDLKENVTNLLVDLSQCSTDTRETILLVLLNEVRRIGRVLLDQISALLVDLRNKMPSSSQTSTVPSLGSARGVVLPMVQGRGSATNPTQQNVYISSMKPLVCKGSQQSFFLRLVNIMCRVYESSCFASTNTKPDTDCDCACATPLSIHLDLEDLWTTLSDCLDVLSNTYDHQHAALVLQPCLVSFFLVHADHNEETWSTHSRYLPSFRCRFRTMSDDSDSETSEGSSAEFDTISPTPKAEENESSDSSANHLPPNIARFLQFAERHCTVLNQILRLGTVPLYEALYAVLVNHIHLLDFDLKRHYFHHKLEQFNTSFPFRLYEEEEEDGDHLVIHARRDYVFEDSYNEFDCRPPQIVIERDIRIIFEGEKHHDAEKLLSEWYLIVTREMFNPDKALFKAAGNKATYMPNPASHVKQDHLRYFKFIGRFIAKAIYSNKLLDCHFTRSFYKHILGKPVHYTDMELEDNAFYRSMVFLLNHEVDEFGAELTFSTEIDKFGETIVKDLKPNGRDIPVTDSNKKEYVQLVCQMKMTGSIRKQIKSFLKGFHEIIPKSLLSIFNAHELELLISGLPNIDIQDLKANTEYHKYTETSLQIQWFWEALRSYSQANRARFLQFVTGTSKVPLQGFVALEGINGIQKFQIHRDDRSTDRLPTAHKCFNHLDLPQYETYDKLNQKLLAAIRECPEGFDFA